jgi:hypothetical protein
MAYDKDFAVAEMMVEYAERYLCEKIPAPPGTPVSQPTDYGIYWAALGQGRTADGRSFPTRPSSNSKGQVEPKEWIG